MVFVISAVLIILVLAFTLFVRQKDLPAPEPVSPTAHLEERKRAIYENLRDLQFEYRMGKLSDHDYAEIKQDLQRQLAAVLAEMEKVQAEAPKPVVPTAVPAARVEAAWVCPRCATRFSQPMKFCGECGQAMAAVTS